MVSLEPNGEGRPAYFQSTYQGAASTTPICQATKPACDLQAKLKLSGRGHAESGQASKRASFRPRCHGT
jgi:hypothetical protein